MLATKTPTFFSEKFVPILMPSALSRFSSSGAPRLVVGGKRLVQIEDGAAVQRQELLFAAVIAVQVAEVVPVKLIHAGEYLKVPLPVGELGMHVYAHGERFAPLADKGLVFVRHLTRLPIYTRLFYPGQLVVPDFRKVVHGNSASLFNWSVSSRLVFSYYTEQASLLSISTIYPPFSLDNTHK